MKRTFQSLAARARARLRGWRPQVGVLGRRALLGAAYAAGGLPFTLLGHYLMTR
ncbi:hypothetical protein [Kitasatospora sp. NPDC085879]|uniref:hypothetical protein n=1 Tax=Kitasatospora sp. NPDC085879 TaxID=3154769 RepID=UPI000BD31465|nr:hypothetical protein [Streptomyces sp. TLI_235]PBC69791.1 hypothetical protein BX265_7144 [Streptomyces sp. TLI_235]